MFFFKAIIAPWEITVYQVSLWSIMIWGVDAKSAYLIIKFRLHSDYNFIIKFLRGRPGQSDQDWWASSGWEPLCQHRTGLHLDIYLYSTLYYNIFQTGEAIKPICTYIYTIYMRERDVIGWGCTIINWISLGKQVM